MINNELELCDELDLYIPSVEVKYWGNPETGIVYSMEIPLVIIENLVCKSDKEIKKQLMHWYQLSYKNDQIH